jgi:hypothetical protein
MLGQRREEGEWPKEVAVNQLTKPTVGNYTRLTLIVLF